MEKPKRKVNRALLDTVATLRCVCCGKPGPNDPHHVTTRKAGGGDTLNNVMPLCRKHHVQWHKVGPLKMSENYPGILNWISIYDRQDVIERSKSKLGKI